MGVTVFNDITVAAFCLGGVSFRIADGQSGGSGKQHISGSKVRACTGFSGKQEVFRGIIRGMILQIVSKSAGLEKAFNGGGFFVVIGKPIRQGQRKIL